MREKENKNQIMNQKEMAQRYVKLLKAIDGVTTSHKKDKHAETWTFTPKRTNALGVTLEYAQEFMGSPYISLDIKGVDCGYWHTAEEQDLDYHVKLAGAALQGEVAYNRSPIFRLKEVCFRVDGAWECTRTEDVGAYHYIKTRKKLTP